MAFTAFLVWNSCLISGAEGLQIKKVGLSALDANQRKVRPSRLPNWVHIWLPGANQKGKFLKKPKKNLYPQEKLDDSHLVRKKGIDDNSTSGSLDEGANGIIKPEPFIPGWGPQHPKKQPVRKMPATENDDARKVTRQQANGTDISGLAGRGLPVIVGGLSVAYWLSGSN